MAGDTKDTTRKFTVINSEESIMRAEVATVYQALAEKGYNPINQLVGYILSGDPTYITTHNNARVIIGSIERDDLLAAMLKDYLEIK
ncbi:MAG: IreB family regulatory phosphoprotein [Clostridia bacterium]|nr:IreB family regulatory phosphoprotein [Clostridia bacterium]